MIYIYRKSKDEKERIFNLQCANEPPTRKEAGGSIKQECSRIREKDRQNPSTVK